MGAEELKLGAVVEGTEGIDVLLVGETDGVTVAPGVEKKVGEKVLLERDRSVILEAGLVFNLMGDIVELEVPCTLAVLDVLKEMGDAAACAETFAMVALTVAGDILNEIGDATTL